MAQTFAVLNSRTIQEHHCPPASQLVQAATAQGFVLVTGGMKTGYRIAAVAGRAAAAPRVVVLDRGIFATFGARLDRDPFGLGPGPQCTGCGAHLGALAVSVDGSCASAQRATAR